MLARAGRRPGKPIRSLTRHPEQALLVKARVDFRRAEPCAEACEMTLEALEKLRAMTESCEKEGRGDAVARGIGQLSEFAESGTCSGGAASLVAKGATTSWFAQPDKAELMQGSVKESIAVRL